MGARVLITGLKARPDLNGTYGHILSFEAAKEHFELAFDFANW